MLRENERRSRSEDGFRFVNAENELTLGGNKISGAGFVDVGGMTDGVLFADFVPVVSVKTGKSTTRKSMYIRTNLWFDRKSDHEAGVGSAKIVEQESCPCLAEMVWQDMDRYGCISIFGMGKGTDCLPQQYAYTFPLYLVKDTLERINEVMNVINDCVERFSNQLF